MVKNIQKEKLEHLKNLVISYQNHCDDSNCEYDGVVKTWKENNKQYILDGYGRLYVTSLNKWNNRNKSFYNNEIVWISNFKYDASINILYEM